MRVFFTLLLFIVMPAKAQQLTLEAACKEISKQQIENADYKPGVDVKANPVKPADIETEAGTEVINYPLEVPVTIDAIEFVNAMGLQALRDAGADLETNIVNVLLHEDGHVEFNGVDITDDIDVQCVDLAEVEAVELEKNPEYEGDDNEDIVTEDQQTEVEKAPDATAENEQEE